VHDNWARAGAPQHQAWLKKVALKHSTNWQQIFVWHTMADTAEGTTVFPSCRQTKHYTQSKRVQKLLPHVS